MMHRFLRLSAFLAGLLLGGLSVLFAFDNPVHTTLAVGNWQLQSIPLWSVALVPLVAGLVAGYFYHLPARMHHFTEHMRHRGLVHDLRKDNEELSRSLDRLLAMPNDDTPAIAAAAAARDVTPLTSPTEALPAGTIPRTAVISAGPASAEQTGHGGTNGHRPSRSERRTHARLLADPEAKRDEKAAAAAAPPAERHARAARSARAGKATPNQVDPS